jgi:hypothetical protein
MVSEPVSTGSFRINYKSQAMQTNYKEELQAFLNKIKQRSKTYVGYPAAVDYEYSSGY